MTTPPQPTLLHLLLADPRSDCATPFACCVPLDRFEVMLDRRDLDGEFSLARSCKAEAPKLIASAERGGLGAYAALMRERLLPAAETSHESYKASGHLDYSSLKTGLRMNFQFPIRDRALDGDSTDLLFALATLLAVLRPNHPVPLAATGAINGGGFVEGVGQVVAKLKAAVSAGGCTPSTEPGAAPIGEERRITALQIAARPLPDGAVVFYPKENDSSEVQALRDELAAQGRAIRLVAVDRLEDATAALGLPIWPTWGEAPWRGLLHYGPKDRAIFFGREADEKKLLKLLVDRERAGVPGALVLAASGAGKSSFLQAGLLPGIEYQLRDGRELRWCLWRPGDAGGKREQAIVASVLQAWNPVLPKGLLGDDAAPASFAQWLGRIDGPALRRLRFMWLIDPFEDLVAGELEPTVVGALCEFVRAVQRDFGVWVLGAVQSRYLERIQAQPALLEAFGDRAGSDKVADGFFRLDPLAPTALRDVIVRPAERAGLTFGPDERGGTLADTIQHDMAGETDALPLMSVTLTRLHAAAVAAKRTELLLADYRKGSDTASSGLKNAIADRATEVFDSASLNDSARRRLPRLLRGLVRRPQADNEDIAPRSLALSDDWRPGTPGRRLIDVFVKERLLIPEAAGGTAAGGERVRVVHKALLTHWPKAAQILRSNREIMLTRERLEANAVAWDGAGRSDDALLTSVKDIIDAKQVRRRLAADLARGSSAALREFLDASLRAAEQRETQEQQRARQELDKERTAKARLKGWALAAALAASLAIAAAGVALWQRSEAIQATQAAMELAAKEADAKRAEARAAENERRARTEADDNARQAIDSEDKAKLAAEEAVRRTLEAERAAAAEKAAARVATLRRLVADSLAMLTGAKAGGDVNAIRMMLAAHRTQPDAAGVASAMLAVLNGPQARYWNKVIETPNAVFAIAFSPDGQRIVSANNETLQLRDAASGEPIGAPLKGHTKIVWCVAFSPDGRRIVSGSTDMTLRLWDATTGEPIGAPLQGHRDGVLSVDFSPDGRRIVSGSTDMTLRLWDATTGESIGPPVGAHTSAVTSVAFSPDGRRIVSASTDSTLRLWDAVSGEPIGAPLQGHRDGVFSVDFSPDGRRIVSGGWDSTVRLWDAASGEPVGEPLRGHTDSVWKVAFSPDSRLIVSGSVDQSLRLWEAASGHASVAIRGHTSIVMSVAFSPDGQRIVSAGDETIRFWDVTSNTALAAALEGHPNGVASVAFSPDGRRIVSGGGDNALRLWDVASGARIGSPLQGHMGPVSSVAFSPDSRRIVSGSEDKTLRLWDAASGEPIGAALQGHMATVLSAAFSPDGRRIASGSEDKTVRLWDAASGEPIGAALQGHTGTVWSVAFSPDGRRIVSGSSDATLRLWDSASGEPIGTALQGHKSQVRSATFSPDGRRIVSGSWDFTLRMWDAASGGPIEAQLRGHTLGVLSVAFSPDSRLIVSGGLDKAVRLWDVTSAQPLGAPLQGHTGAVTSVAFSPNGRRIASGDMGGSLVLWHAPSAWPNLLCSKLTRNFSKKEWDQYIGPELPYVIQCPGLPVPKAQSAERPSSPNAPRLAGGG